MFSINTRIDRNGFWYLVELGQEVSYSFNYFALGSQGKFCSGEIEGNTAHSKGWQFCGVNFPILHLGITSFDVEETEVTEQTAADVQTLASVDISRRSMINQTVSSLLIGGAFVSSLMGASQSAHAAPAQQRSSPYHSPYHSPYNPRKP